MANVDKPSVIGARLRHLRKFMEMGQIEICAEINVTQGSWSQWEAGKRPLPLEPAARLCKRYGVTLGWLYFGDTSGMPRRYDALSSAEWRKVPPPQIN